MDRKTYIANNPQLASYIEWSEKYPDHLILKRMHQFYVAWGRSAEVVHEILDYRLSYSEDANIAFTGGPNLQKIIDALKKNGINYIVVESGEIIDEEVFAYCEETFYRPEDFCDNAEPTETEETVNDSALGYQFSVGDEIQTNTSPETYTITKIDADTVQLLHKRFIDKPPKPDDFEGKIYQIDDTEFIIIRDLGVECFNVFCYKTFNKKVLLQCHPKESKHDYLKHHKTKTAEHIKRESPPQKSPQKTNSYNPGRSIDKPEKKKKGKKPKRKSDRVIVAKEKKDYSKKRFRDQDNYTRTAVGRVAYGEEDTDLVNSTFKKTDKIVRRN